VTVTALLEELRGREVELKLVGDRLRYRAPKGVLTPELKRALVDWKPEVIAALCPMPAPILECCPTCGEPTKIEIVRGRFTHSYCLARGHYDAWATTDGARFGDLMRWMIDQSRGGNAEGGA
jgi:hypothetical protein